MRVSKTLTLLTNVEDKLLLSTMRSCLREETCNDCGDGRDDCGLKDNTYQTNGNFPPACQDTMPIGVGITVVRAGRCGAMSATFNFLGPGAVACFPAKS